MKNLLIFFFLIVGLTRVNDAYAQPGNPGADPDCPSVFLVSGGGTICSGSTGVTIALSGSQTHIDYQLKINGSVSGPSVSGTGSALSWVDQTTAGTYTITATNTSISCSAEMSGSATVTVNPSPAVFNVTGGGSMCSGSSGGLAVVLSGSQSGINYQLKLGSTDVGAPVGGTGSSLTWPNNTTAGTYTVIARNPVTDCYQPMSGSATVIVNPLPTVFILSGGGQFCSGPGITITLNGSETETSYQLRADGLDAEAPVAGTGSLLSWITKSAGTYTVMAINNTSTCTQVMSGSAVVTVDQICVALDKWAFQYKYDSRNRIVAKKTPGADWVYMVYDNRDRLVLTQDGNQRNVNGTKEWTFTKYDALNRPILSGKYLNNNDREAMQIAVNNYYSVIDAGEAWFETYEGSTGDVLGYSNSSFPNVSAASDYYTATYYDAYDTYIAPTGYTYSNESLPGQETSSFNQVIGQVTASLVKNLTSGAFLRTVNYYDDRYRVIQTVADHHKGTIRTSNVYDFSGKLLISKRTYVVNSVTRTVKETFTYDHAGRVLNVKHSADGAADIMIVKNEYNELGQLIDKKLHSTDGGTTFKQSVDHRYNIRGWLTKINESDVGALASGDPAYDHFGMELAYDNTVNGLSTTQMYNGNISAIKWSKGNGGAVGRQAYTYKYDPMNRLEEASHFDYLVAAWAADGKSFQEKIHEYDLNGNIRKLSRREFGGMLMDSLHYSYTGNKLDYVHDYGHQSEGFVNTNTQTDDYDYDFNGNLDKDRNKGLLNKGNIKYNHLNLPVEVIKGIESIKYIYDATGRKLAQEVYTDNGATLVKYTDYIGEMVFEGNALQFIQHPEGRVLPDGGGWEYQYHLKDHLGNVRVTFTTKPQAPVNYTANLETGTGGSGEGVFGNYTSTTYDLVDHTDGGTTYQKVQWLNGGASGRVGLTKSLSVMPGDIVSVTAYAKYMNLSGTGNSNPFAAALTAAFGVSSGSTGEQLKLYNSLNDYGLSVAGGEHAGDDDTAPKAFVTILLFDRNFNLLDAAWDQINTTEGPQVSATVKEPPHDQLSREVTVQEAGYAYIFLSNEHPTYVDVYFDDVTVGHTLSPIVSSADYYPFGGKTSNSYQREGSLKNRYLYNAGSELVDDLGIEVYQTEHRMYDPWAPRWWQIDPKTEGQESWSPYHYSFNNPIRYNDPKGDCPPGTPCFELLNLAIADAAAHPNGVGAHTLGVAQGLQNSAEGLVNAVSHPVQTLQGLGNMALAGIAGNPATAMQMDAALGTNSYGTMMGVTNAVMNGANNLINGNGMQRGTVIGEIGGAILGSKGLSAGLRLGGNALSMGLRSVTTSDGFLFGSMSIKAPFNIPVQRFGAMSISGESAFGLRTGSSAFAARTFNAILPKWNNLTNYTIGTIPKGTGIRIGITAPQGLRFPGGFPQITVKPRLVINQSTKLVY